MNLLRWNFRGCYIFLNTINCNIFLYIIILRFIKDRSIVYFLLFKKMVIKKFLMWIYSSRVIGRFPWFFFNPLKVGSLASFSFSFSSSILLAFYITLVILFGGRGFSSWWTYGGLFWVISSSICVINPFSL